MIRVRRLEPKDKAAWLPLFKGYIAFYKAAVADDVIELTWTRLLSSDQAAVLGLAAVDGNDTPVGIAHVVFHSSTWSATHYCYLEDLFVDPESRGQGAGRRLIEAVYQEADARTCTRTYWITQDFNYPARMLYDQLATKSVFVQYRR